MIASIPYWRLSSFYFFYFALVGALNPYLGLYLTDIGLTAQSVGIVSGVLMGTKVIAPNLWGWLCDYTGQRLKIIAVGSFVAMIAFTGLFYWQSLIPILVVVFLFSFFWNAILSQFDTVTVQYLNRESHRYSLVRLWGSIGFMVAVVVLGWLFDVFNIQYLIPVSWVLLGLIWLITLTLKEPEKVVVHESSFHWFILLRKPVVATFFLAAFLLQFSFGAYYSFFSLHLESYQYSRTSIGLLWALGVLAEIILFLVIHRIMTKVDVTKILFWSLLLTAVRWLLIAFFTDYLAVVIIAQAIHALSFGATHAVCVELIRRFFQGQSAGQGQALYSAIGFGLGGGLGAIFSGFLWDMSSQLVFLISAIVVFIAAVIVWFGLCQQAIDGKLSSTK